MPKIDTGEVCRKHIAEFSIDFPFDGARDGDEGAWSAPNGNGKITDGSPALKLSLSTDEQHPHSSWDEPAITRALSYFPDCTRSTKLVPLTTSWWYTCRIHRAGGFARPPPQQSRVWSLLTCLITDSLPFQVISVCSDQTTSFTGPRLRHSIFHSNNNWRLIEYKLF